MSQSPELPMTVEEARRVMWLRSNHRPLGELIDEGYLTRPRLEWAAENAYSPAVKQAAQVLLSSKAAARPSPKPTAGMAVEAPSTTEPERGVPIGITMDRARATEWPYRPYRGKKMGELVESQTLSLKDLGFAIENAWEKGVRRAAVALMLVRLNQVVKEPAQSAGPLDVVSGGRSHAERRQSSLTLAQGFIFGAVLASLCFLFVLSLARQSVSPGRPITDYFSSLSAVIGLVLGLAVLIGLGWLFLFAVERTVDNLDKLIEDYRKGQEGEDRVEIALRQALDGSWALFRNVTLPGRKKSDIDGILVGPPGIWALEVKTLSGEYRNRGEDWEYRAGNRWKAAKARASRQAKRNAGALNSFLAADGIKQWVSPAVVWANPDSPLTVENPSVAVWTLDRLPDEVGNIWVDDVVPESIRNRIVEKLTQLCQRQEAAQRARSK